MLRLFNADHTAWKTVVLPKPAQATLLNIGFLSETEVNSDAQLEIGYGYFVLGTGIAYTSNVINEAGSVLLALPNASGVTLSKMDGLATKLIALSNQSTVYGLPGLNLEHVYPRFVVRTELDVSGEKYYEFSGSQLLVYNSDHTPWKTVSLPALDMYFISAVNGVFERKFDQDDQLEVAYTIANNILIGSVFHESYVIKENGQLLLAVPQASNLYLSEMSGSEDKMIAYLSGGDQSMVNYSGKVYSIDDTMKTNDFTHSVSVVYPNPVCDVLRFKTNVPVVKVQVHDVLGKLVKHEDGQDITQIDVGKLSAGYYTVSLTGVNQMKSVHKVLVAH